VNELDELVKLRRKSSLFSEHARTRARILLVEEISRRPPRRRSRPRWAVLVTGVTAALGALILGCQAMRTPDESSEAEAATVLNQAAVAAVQSTEPKPRPDQFLYRDVLHQTGRLEQRVQTWTSVDGSRAGLVRTEGFLGSDRLVVQPYDPADGLYQAPYTVLAALPTEPVRLLQVLYSDPYVTRQVQGGAVDRDVAVWNVLRDLVETAPPAQRAALFQAARQIPGIVYIGRATDAAGRAGEAIGLTDPHVGCIQFVFDEETHSFLGERIVDPRNLATVRFSATIRQAGIVGNVDELPHR